MFRLKRKESIGKELIEKELIEKELELYKREKQLEIDKLIHQKKVKNWADVDEARIENIEETINAKTENAKLIAGNKAMKKEVEMLIAENKFLRDVVNQYAKQQVIINTKNT